jgi:Carboxypeptidase regulatory-like domain
MTPTKCWKSAFLFVFLLSFAAAAFAQTTGDIRGVVKDPQDLPIAGARVTATMHETGISRHTVTGADGAYEFPTMAVGHYTLRVESQGFKTYVDTGIELTLGHVAEVNPVLQLGSVTQEVTTTAAAPLVETNSSQLGAVVNSRMVVQLPLDQRDTYQLLQLQPGVQAPQGNSFIQGSGETGMVSVNGGRARNNNFMVNGGDANDQFINGPGVQPSPDTIQEFRVLTNTFNAEYGRNSGSVINVVTKSGTNAFHGDAYEFLRNDSLDARGFFDTSKAAFKMNQFGGTLGGPIQKDKTFFFASYEGRRIRQGISGQVVTVPTVAERNGDFSMGGTESPFAGSITDDFVAQTLNSRPGCAQALGGAIPLPSQSNTGSVSYASIFPNNQIPASCFDPTALSLMNKYVPLPNVGADQYQAVLTEPVWDDQTTGRIDHVINDRQQLTGYYYFDDSYTLDPWGSFEGAGPSLPGFGAVNGYRYQQSSLTHTWAINATTVNVFRFAAFREAQGQNDHPQHPQLVEDSCGADPSTCFSDPANPGLGITPGLGADHEGVPFVSLAGGFSYGNNFEGELPQIGNSFQWEDNFSKVLGNHTTKFGGGVTRQRFDQELFYNVNGQFGLSGGGPNDVQGNDLVPNYLLGLPDNFGQGGAQWENVRDTLAHLYAQDSWKIRPSVMLNFGLRWELDTPLGDEGQRVQTFRPGQATQIYPCKLSPDNPLVQTFGTTNCNPGSAGESVFPLGLVVPGDKGISNGMTQTYYKSFAPRVGLAWSPGAQSGWLAKLTGGPGKTSVRMGWGIFYNPIEQLVLEQFSAEPPFGGSSFVYNTLFNTPYLGQDGTIYPNPFNGVKNPPRGQPVDWSQFRPILLFGEMPPKLRSQYADQYNFTIQRELTQNLVFQAAYVGSQGHRLLANYDINNGSPQTCLDLQAISNYYANSNPNLANNLSCGPYYEDSSFYMPAGAIPAGMTLHLPYGSVKSVTGPNNPAITLVGLRPYSSPYCQPTTGVGCPPDGIPVFSSTYAIDTIANSSYNSLQLSVEKRFSQGLQFLAAYTWSKSLDDASTFEEAVLPGCLSCRRSYSLFNSPQVFVLSYYWEIPVHSLRGVAGALADGWAMSGITTFQTGFPILVPQSPDQNLGIDGLFGSPASPDWNGQFITQNPRNAGCAYGTGPSAGTGAPPCQTVANQYFNPNTFSDQPLGTFGNAPRTICCGPGINNFDFAMLKEFRISENKQLQFRAEAFNIFNHANFMNPDGAIGDGSVFGTITSAGPPRLLQVALKFLF